jgi:hypothetical protein
LQGDETFSSFSSFKSPYSWWKKMEKRKGRGHILDKSHNSQLVGRRKSAPLTVITRWTVKKPSTKGLSSSLRPGFRPRKSGHSRAHEFWRHTFFIGAHRWQFQSAALQSYFYFMRSFFSRIIGFLWIMVSLAREWPIIEWSKFLIQLHMIQPHLLTMKSIEVNVITQNKNHSWRPSLAETTLNSRSQ